MSAVTYSRFPAAVSSPKRSERRGALIVADGTARLAVIVAGQGVQVVEEFTVTEVQTSGRSTTLIEDDGTEWQVARGDGCGCGSPLRTWYNQQLGTPRRSGS